MIKGISSPLSLLQESLLGEAAGEVLSLDRLTEELMIACRELAAPLHRLSLGDAPSEDVRARALSASTLAMRMSEPMHALQAWALAETPSGGVTLAPETLGDFWYLVMMARSLTETLETPPPDRLLHLLGLVGLRLRLEKHVGLTPALPIVVGDGEPYGLSVTEIAALCGLKLSTVRNALSRREMHYQRDSGVGLDEALDWMVQRSGFLYPHVNAATRDRRINGRLAAEWLAASDAVVYERSISRLRLSIWRSSTTGRRFALNTEGVRSCVVLLPETRLDELGDIPLDGWEERGRDPSATMHREALGLEEGAALLQCQIPTTGALAAIVDCLGTPRQEGEGGVARQSVGRCQPVG
ncbi:MULTISPECIES: hypothetical protein [unclassified Modicisalibacter]|uniref:hypothetical protein n=1 Tax=unclassified Modicisalibacter TaxID=2679913 RepID=UPI001CCB9CB8|nr:MULTISPECIES: hypothetical protein [unclassified Modicisalibacter]MBZ9556723.1 hypothetical protein [Modicisalibacter sp. R2A 31.J]MBZ9574808.1 hypothetical protein [Modicisalibacter sp. MOD 31.J]